VDSISSNAHFEIEADGNITLDAAGDIALEAAGDIALEAAGNDITVDSDTLTVTSSTADQPIVKLLNTTDDDQASQLIFEKLRDDDAVAQGQNLGEVWFRGQDGSQNTEDYAYIIGEIDVSTHGQESGQLALGVASHDGGNNSGLVLTGGSVDNEVDITIGHGVSSVTTVAGDLVVTGHDLTFDSVALTAVQTSGESFADNDTSLMTSAAIEDKIHTTQRQLTHHMIKDDIGTGVVYIGLNEADAENSGVGNKYLPLLAPVAGKLLKIFLRTGTNIDDTNLTWRLYTRASSETTAGVVAEIGAQTGAGPTNSTMTTYDFTSSLDDPSGTNVIAAGDKVQLSVQSDAASGDQNFFITCLWEWDLS
jgi:hypothetical protein